MLGLRHPGFEFEILCLDGSVISLISQSPEGSPGPIQPVCAVCVQKWHRARLMPFICHSNRTVLIF